MLLDWQGRQPRLRQYRRRKHQNHSGELPVPSESCSGRESLAHGGLASVTDGQKAPVLLAGMLLFSHWMIQAVLPCAHDDERQVRKHAVLMRHGLVAHCCRTNFDDPCRLNHLVMCLSKRAVPY